MARTKNNVGLTMFILKIIAILAMLASHTEIVFDKEIPGEIQIWLFYFGRLALPLFAFSIANGWKHTKNKPLYVLRIAIMALVSQIPFAVVLKGVELFDFRGAFFASTLNIGFTFLLAILSLVIYNLLRKIDFPILIACICAIVPAVAFELLTPFHVDYGYFGVALILIMYALINDRTAMLFASAAILACMSVKTFGAEIIIRADTFLAYLVSLLLITLYNGKRGARAKYLFYIFYPLHMIVLYLLQHLI